MRTIAIRLLHVSHEGLESGELPRFLDGELAFLLTTLAEDVVQQAAPHALDHAVALFRV